MSAEVSRSLDGVGIGTGDLADQLDRGRGLLTAARKQAATGRSVGLARALRRLADAAAQVDAATETAVHLARHEGASWDSVGRALGVSRQAAWERFARDREGRP